MVFRRKKILSQWFDSIEKKTFCEPMIYTIKKENFLTDGPTLSVASMTDSIDR